MYQRETHYNGSTAFVIKHVCGLLFVLFSFCYLFFLQGELMAKAQFVYSNGKTSYSIFWGALIITAILRVIQLPVQRFIRVPLRFHALTYIPSIVILTIICSINSKVLEHFSLGLWWLGIPLLAALFYGLVLGARHLDSYQRSTFGSQKFAPILIPNFIVLMLSLLWCGACHSASDLFMFEQKVERLVANGKYEDALKVGEKSFSANPRLTNLRMFALAKTGQLPDRLFDYPQYYGIDGLLCLNDTSERLYRFDANDICRELNVEASEFENTRQLVEELARCQTSKAEEEDSVFKADVEKYKNMPDSLTLLVRQHDEQWKKDNKFIDDYILCAYLLERDMDSFRDQIEHSCYRLYVNRDQYLKLENTDMDADSLMNTVFPHQHEALPVVYRQALLITDPEDYYSDDEMLDYYDEYKALRKEQESDSTRRANITRKEKSKDKKIAFGHSFWWYYDNPNITK